MPQHLQGCRLPVPASRTVTPGFHLLVQGRYDPEFWLHLGVPAAATLDDLDAFLRTIWLECCGHLSQFEFQDATYVSNPVVAGDLGGSSMKVALGSLLRPGLLFYHQYDFGSPTDLSLTVVGERPLPRARKPIQLLARNEAPAIRCSVCGALATQVCGECLYEGSWWLCEGCAGEHECGEEALLPVVNSPGVGTCGYVG